MTCDTKSPLGNLILTMYHLRLIKKYREPIISINLKHCQPDLQWKLKCIGLKWFLKLSNSSINKRLLAGLFFVNHSKVTGKQRIQTKWIKLPLAF